MIVAPDILSQIKEPPLSSDSSFGCQPALEVAPEAFQPVDVAPAPIAERLAVVHQPVDAAPRCDTRVAGKGVLVPGIVNQRYHNSYLLRRLSDSAKLARFSDSRY